MSFDEPEVTQINEEAQDLQTNEQQSPIHNRMNTDQRIELAVMQSQMQVKFDNRLSEYLEIIKKLEEQLLEERTKNVQLTKKLNERHLETSINLKKGGNHPRGVYQIGKE